MPQPGGELSLIPIEQLIQIEDIKPTPKAQPTSSSTATMSVATNLSTVVASPQVMTPSSSALAAAMQQFQSSGNH